MRRTLPTYFRSILVFCAACALAVATALAGARSVQSVTAPGLALQFDGQGRICGGTVGAGKLPMVVSGGSALGGFTTVGPVKLSSRAGGACVITRRVHDAHNRLCTVTDRFTPTTNSIRWEMEVVSDAREPWTAPLELGLKLDGKASTRFWTAWLNGSLWNETDKLTGETDLASLIPDGNTWGDPLTPMPLINHTWEYGNSKGTICIPIATVLEPDTEQGLSLVLSPEQPILSAALSNNPDGTILFRHSLLRLGGGRSVKFIADIVPHEADWRGGLRWMVGRYPDYFNPPNSKVAVMAGCGAYSHYQGALDVARLKQMSFRVNWNAAFEWPWFGMFLPPVPSWRNQGQDTTGNAVADRIQTFSYQSMNDYCRSMRQNGFFALNYFNVLEFGSKLHVPFSVNTNLAPADEWTDAATYFCRKMPHALLLDVDGRPFYSWGDSVAIDCGDPAAQRHLLEQARRNIKVLPDSPGICIDVLKYLVQVNYAPGADDHLGWYGQGRPGRLLALSWLDAISKIGPLMHHNGRVIFVNPCRNAHRLDLFREVDGIYDEYGQTGYALNGSCLLALRKPAIMWTHDAGDLKPDPDSYFQRHLYLGAYPTVPFPGNDHTALPDAALEQWYLDYGPLLDAMRGKKWVLAPHCVESATPGVKVNLFEVPGGYALPVTFGGSAETATVRVRNLKHTARIKCQALQPGVASPIPVPATLKDGVLEITVPLKHGCAMVKMFSS